MTNAQKIRAMSDEELVVFLRHFFISPPKGAFLDWLRQPAEG